jgi:hypothetical protein
MTLPMDQTSDPGFSRLSLLLSRYPKLASFTKSANIDGSEYKGLPDASFAWPGTRRFPIHTREHAAISYGYSKLAESLPSDVQETLEKVAEAWDIEVDDMFSQGLHKVASEDSADYLLPDIKRFRVKTAEDIPVMERAFVEKYAQLSVDERAEAGYNLIKLSEQHDVKLHPQTNKLAGFTITSTAVLRDWVGARRVAAEKVGSAIAPVYTQLSESLGKMPAHIHDRQEQTKLATLISDLDNKAGITPFYGNHLPDPLRTVFNTDQVVEDYVKIGSALQNKALMASLPLSFWEDALGADVTKDIAPGGQLDTELLEQVLPTLPDDMKATLERQLAAYNK